MQAMAESTPITKLGPIAPNEACASPSQWWFAHVHVTGKEKMKPGKKEAIPVMTALTRLRRNEGP